MKTKTKCGARFRKPVGQITDRAKRYRANSPGCKPKGNKCEECGSTKNLVTGHRDGNESNGRPYNLGTFCKRCNTKDGKADAKAGRGVRTRQYNPPDKVGANSLGEYVSAAVSHTRGAHDEGGRVIHETPKAKRREFAAEIWRRRGRNPESEAGTLYRKFHGRGPDSEYTIDVPEIDPYASHPAVAQLGFLTRLIVGEGVLKMGGEYGDKITKVEETWWAEVIEFVDFSKWIRWLETGNPPIAEAKAFLRKSGCPDVASEPNARQLYIVGGKQELSDEMLRKLHADPGKDICDLGFCYLIDYFTQKRFDRFEPTNYFHHFGEKTGVPPRLVYWRAAKMLQLVGGEYVVTPRGIEN